MVIINTEVYYEKIDNFISENQFTRMVKDPTDIYCKQVKQVINKSKIERNNEKLKLRNTPKIKGLMKLRKAHTPIRPVINSCNSPAYNLGKYKVKYLDNLLNLPYSFNVKNSPHLINDLTELQVNVNKNMFI